MGRKFGRRGEISRLLREDARSAVSGTDDLWPAIYARLGPSPKAGRSQITAPRTHGRDSHDQPNTLTEHGRIASRRFRHQHPWRRRALFAAAVILALFLLAELRLFDLPRFDTAALFPAPSVAYTFVAGHIATVDPTNGVILMRSGQQYGDQFPSLAVSHDGRSLFVLHTVVEGNKSSDQLTVLSAQTLEPQTNVPVTHFMQSMDAWPPALAVTPDDHTVVVYQFGNSENDPYWLSYYDRASGRFLADQTTFPACGVAQLLPVGEQLAVVCFGTGQVYLVNLANHQVITSFLLDPPNGGSIGLPVAAGVIPGQNAIAVVEDHGRMLRVDLSTHAVSLMANLVPANTEFPAVVATAFSDNGRAAVSVATNKDDASGQRARDLLIVDTASGHILEEVPVVSLYGLTMAPDGQRVFLRGDSDTLYQLDLNSRALSAFGPEASHLWVHLIFARS